MRTFPVCTVAFACLAVILGCGQGKSVVKGKVTYKNQVLTSGEVHFVGSQGTPRSALIDPDGSFVVEDPPLGQVNVAVVAFENKEAGGPTVEKGNSLALRRPANIIPPKYNDVKTSGLSYTLSAGTQTIEITLTD